MKTGRTAFLNVVFQAKQLYKLADFLKKDGIYLARTQHPIIKERVNILVKKHGRSNKCYLQNIDAEYQNIIKVYCFDEFATNEDLCKLYPSIKIIKRII